MYSPNNNNMYNASNVQGGGYGGGPPLPVLSRASSRPSLEFEFPLPPLARSVPTVVYDSNVCVCCAVDRSLRTICNRRRLLASSVPYTSTRCRLIIFRCHLFWFHACFQAFSSPPPSMLNGTISMWFLFGRYRHESALSRLTGLKLPSESEYINEPFWKPNFNRASAETFLEASTVGTILT